jgi:quercetin dioxygenase-like cupin family protein
MTEALAKTARFYQAWKINPADSNRFAMIFDPQTDGANFIACVEIFDVGGKTPPNTHPIGQEFFFILKGEGIAYADGKATNVHAGDALLLKPGIEHALHNVGPGRLYCLTMMVPDDGFTALILGGVPSTLDDEDLAVLGGVRGAGR